MIGVRLTQGSVVACAVDSAGRVVEARAAGRRDDLAAPLTKALSELATHLAEPDSITFDVSADLTLASQLPVTVIRVVPRPPINSDHEIGIDRDLFLVESMHHIEGGHTAMGRELVPLDTSALLSIAGSNSDDARYLVTSVGALITPDHELEVERLITDHSQAASVEGSRVFHSSAFAVRERTALVNHALLPGAEALGTLIAQVAERVFPGSDLFVMTNDGGRVPLSRLMVSPVHSLLAGKATALVGAAALSGVRDGRLLVTRGQESFLGEMLGGELTVIPYAPESVAGRLATPTANWRDVAPEGVRRFADAGRGAWRPPTFVTEEPQAARITRVSDAALHTSLDLGALGAACATLSDWSSQFISVANADELAQRMQTAEARVTARLVTAGAAPSQTRIIESHIATTAYEAPSVVAVRVRGVAGSYPNLDLVEG